MKLRYTTLTLYLLLSVFLQAQNSVEPEEITIKDGLSQGFVSTMIQDKEGFLWFGTKNGLNRYDGEHFQVFVHAPYDPYSISGDFIRDIYENGDFLLIGTHRNGLCIYHKQSRRFYKIPNSILGYAEDDISVQSLMKDDIGQFWYKDALNKKLVRIQFPDNFWKLLPTDETVLNQIKVEYLPMTNIYFIQQSYDSNRLIVSNTPINPLLWLIDIESMEKKDITPKISSDTYAFKNFTPIDKEHLLVAERSDVSDYDQSYVNTSVWNYKENTWESIRNNHKIKASFLLNAPYFGFKSIDDEWLFFDRNNAKITSFDPSDALFKYQKDAVDIESSLVDQSGNLWLGTNGFGILKMTPRKSKIKTYGDFYFGNIPYMSTTGEVLVDLDLNIRLKTYYYPGEQPIFQKNGLLNFYKTHHNARTWDGKDGVLWVTGINETGGHLAFQIPKGEAISRNAIFNMDSEITAFGRDDENNLVLFANFNGLISYNTKTGKVTKNAFPLEYKGKDRVFSLAKTKDGRWWLGTSGGLLECVFNGDGFFNFKLFKGNINNSLNDAKNSIDLLNNQVASLLIDPEDANILWMGTKGGGLHRLDTRSMEITHLTSRNGLPNDVIYSVLNDDDGNLWMSSNKGIIRYNPKTGKISNFTESDGMQSNEFNTWSYAKGPNGELLFGGIKGLNIFHPNDLKDIIEVPNVVITGMTINNKNIHVNDSTTILKKAIDFTSKINLPFSKNSISLQFAGLEYTAPSKNKFRYFLEGAESPWVHEGTQNKASYLNLAPGNYTFKIKGANSDGIWSDVITELKINILPPWYRTNLAYFIYLSVLGLGIWQFLKFQRKRIKLQYRVETEHKETERLKELDISKTRLYTNITHEFRTPLTVISGIAGLIKGNSESKTLIQRNSDQLLNLINQMLDLRKLESGEITIQKTRGDIIKFLRYLTESLKSYAELKGLTFHFLSEKDSLLMDFDEEKITRIHSNLLSNAIKFTPKGGDIYLQLDVEEKEMNKSLILKIKDTGVGISKEELPRIFDRFYQVDDSSTRKGEGTGIGLTLVFELVKAMDGDIKVSSNQGKGTTFSITLPITNSAELAKDSYEKIANASMVDIATPTLPIAKTSETKNLEKPVVLIVEDNPDVIHYLINCLKEQYAIEIAMNGEEGIEKAIENIPDIIVSDVMMPIKDGFELCQTLKIDERTSHIPIILLTAKADIESRLEGLQKGADAYLSKPFHQEELLIILQSQLVLRKNLQVRFSQLTQQSSSTEVTATIAENNIEIELEIEDAFLQKIRDIIEKDLSNSEIGMLQLVRQIGMSRSQIFKKVKALTGNSPSIYMRSIRLYHAQELLKKNELNISEIAYKVGFSSPVYFSDVYLEEFGVRPNETRK